MRTTAPHVLAVPRARWLIACSLLVGWLLSATPAAAATLITASGTFVRTSFVQSNIRQVDGVTLFDFTEHGVRSGTFSGTSVVQGSCVVRASGQASCQAVETFTGTVAGETGTVVLHDVVASDLATGSVHGSFTVVHGGSLTNVHGHGTFQGTGGTRTYSALLVLAP